MDAAAQRLLLDYSRWLVDRHGARLSSIESRSASLLGWGGVQVSITTAVLALASGVPAGWARTTGAALLAFGGLMAATAVVMVVAGVLRTRTVVEPESDLTTLRSWTAASSGDDAEWKLADRLVGALNDGDDRSKSVLVEFAAEVDSRARVLRCASIVLTAAVGLDALAALMIAYATTQ
jgi:hypothetical protein